MHDAFKEELGLTDVDLKALPPLQEPLAGAVAMTNGTEMLLSNAYWVQALSNLFHSDVVVG